MKLFSQYMTIFFNFQTTSSHLHPLQVKNCDSNSRLVVDEDDNGKFWPERVNITFRPERLLDPYNAEIFMYKPWRSKGFSIFEIIINVLVSFPINLKADVMGLRPL